jgi:hypothetical protein
MLGKQIYTCQDQSYHNVNDLKAFWLQYASIQSQQLIANAFMCMLPLCHIIHAYVIESKSVHQLMRDSGQELTYHLEFLV